MTMFSTGNSSADAIEVLSDAELLQVGGGCTPVTLLGGRHGTSRVVVTPPCLARAPKRAPRPGAYIRGRGWVADR